jgi:hypothetical protein
MHKHIIAIAGLAAALAVAGVASAEEKTLNVSRNASSGTDSLLAYAGRWDRDCKELPIKINFTGQPAHGTAWSVETDRVIPASTPAMGDTGKNVKSKKIMYRSATGFRGSDTVGYVSEGGGLVIRTMIAVTEQ